MQARVTNAWDGCRYNRLLSTIHQSLHDLLKAVKGLVVMSQDLEKMANSLYMNAVPAQWAGKVWQSRRFRNRQRAEPQTTPIREHSTGGEVS